MSLVSNCWLRTSFHIPTSYSYFLCLSKCLTLSLSGQDFHVQNLLAGEIDPTKEKLYFFKNHQVLTAFHLRFWASQLSPTWCHPLISPQLVSFIGPWRILFYLGCLVPSPASSYASLMRNTQGRQCLSQIVRSSGYFFHTRWKLVSGVNTLHLCVNCLALNAKPLAWEVCYMFYWIY